MPHHYFKPGYIPRKQLEEDFERIRQKHEDSEPRDDLAEELGFMPTTEDLEDDYD